MRLINTSQNIKKVINLLFYNELDENSTEKEIKTVVKEWLLNITINDIDEFQSYSFFDINNYVECEKDESLFKLMFTLTLIKSCIIEELTEKDDIDFGPITRKVSPDLKAYEYTGVSKLDIGTSRKSYGTIFE